MEPGDPKVQFVRTRDNIHLAYFTLGDGPPLVILPSLVSNIESELQGARRNLYLRLAKSYRVVAYDSRGHGLSTRKPENLSQQVLVDDLEAILDRLELEKAVLFARLAAGPTAIAFATSHPERTSHLILWQALPSFADYFETFGGALPLVRGDWNLFTLTAAHIRVGWQRPTQARSTAAIFRDSVDQEFYIRELESSADFDAWPLLPTVTTPTLVMSHRNIIDSELNISKRLATEIPNAKLAFLNGDSGIIHDEPEEMLWEIASFLGIQTPEPILTASPGPEDDLPRGLTRREVQILRFLAEGHRHKEISLILGISVHTVSRHVATIYEKLQAHGRTDAILLAIKLGLLSIDRDDDLSTRE